MNRYGKIAGIIIGLILFAALAFYIAPKISTLTSTQLPKATTAPDNADDSDGVKSLENFLANLNTNTQYSFCAVKTVKDQDAETVQYYGRTTRGDDYAIKAFRHEQELRQLYIDGEYTYINDTKKTVYINVQNIDIPDTHFQKVISGKVIKTDGEIIDGNQLDCVRLYKNGTVYAVYFNQHGELMRFYYIYDSKEIVIDFCGFYFGDMGEFAHFDISPSYKKGVWDPSNEI